MSTLLVAQAGGHLQELFHLAPRLQVVDDEQTWVTIDTPQSRSLLADTDAIFVPGARPHDMLTTVRNLSAARNLIAHRRFRYAVSTGSSIAVSFLPLARLYGTECHYIESVARIDGPSLTGKILARVPGIRLYTQSRDWSYDPWCYEGSVFDGFRVEKIHPEAADARQVRRIVVTVGSSVYGFDSLIAHLAKIIPESIDVLWQTGSSDVTGLQIPAQPMIPADDLFDAIASADVVIGHAGTGTALVALEAGKCPILVPRRLSRREHIDDHQVQIARTLHDAGLARTREVSELTWHDIEDVAEFGARAAEDVAKFRLH